MLVIIGHQHTNLECEEGDAGTKVQAHPRSSGFGQNTLASQLDRISTSMWNGPARRRAMRLPLTLPSLVVVISTAVLAQFPMQQSFVLHQNDPNPFCPRAHTATCILFEMSEAPYATLEVWTPDTSAVLSSLIREYLAAGLHMVCWDGRDDSGQFVTDGMYPYIMTVADSLGGAIIFADTLIATVECRTACEGSTWGRLKTL